MSTFPHRFRYNCGMSRIPRAEVARRPVVVPKSRGNETPNCVRCFPDKFDTRHACRIIVLIVWMSTNLNRQCRPNAPCSDNDTDGVSPILENFVWGEAVPSLDKLVGTMSLFSDKVKGFSSYPFCKCVATMETQQTSTDASYLHFCIVCLVLARILNRNTAASCSGSYKWSDKWTLFQCTFFWCPFTSWHIGLPFVDTD